MFSSSKLKHSTSDSADKNGVKNRLKKFIIRRPSMKTLQEKGLIKGVCLFFLQTKTYKHTTAPMRLLKLLSSTVTCFLLECFLNYMFMQLLIEAHAYVH